MRTVRTLPLEGMAEEIKQAIIREIEDNSDCKAEFRFLIKAEHVKRTTEPGLDIRCRFIAKSIISETDEQEEATEGPARLSELKGESE